MKYFKVIILIYITGFLMLSCENRCTNVIYSDDIIDSSRYFVNIDTINQFEGRIMFALDSSDFYLCSSNEFVHYSDNYYQHLDFKNNFYAISISGFDRNNIFIGGYNSYSRKPMLCKWDGVGLIEIEDIDSSNNTYEINNILVKSLAKVWMAAEEKNILKYDGYKFTKYFIDSLLTNSYFLINENNKLCCVRYNDSGNIYHTSGVIYFKFYELMDDKWVFKSSLNYEYPKSEILFPINIGNRIIANTKNELYSFDSYNYKKIQSVNKIIMRRMFGDFRASSINNYFVSGFLNNKHYYFHWDGNKFSLENEKELPDLLNYFCFENIIIGQSINNFKTLIFRLRKKI